MRAPGPQQKLTTAEAGKKDKAEAGATAKKTKKSKDLDAPKPASSAYALYCAKARAEMPAGTPFGEVAKKLGEGWKELEATGGGAVVIQRKDTTTSKLPGL